MVKNLLLLGIVVCTLSIWCAGQTPATAAAAPVPCVASNDKPKRPPIFRANKSQIKDAQAILKDKQFYNGEFTGKLDPDTRAGLKRFQKDVGIRATGTLNRATLEKMNIELTDKQKEVSVTQASLTPLANREKTPKGSKPAASKTSTASKGDAGDKPKHTIFRATSDQVRAAQKLLKDKTMYNGDQTGKLDPATRDGLRKFQDANGIKVTGTLNAATLEKMGIALTDGQKETASTSSTTTPN